MLQRRYQTMGFRVDDPWERNLPAGEAFAAYDPAAAKKLLAEAGYPNGFDLTVDTHLTVRPVGEAVVGDGTISEPGRYAILCFIPVGADPAEPCRTAAAVVPVDDPGLRDFGRR